MKQLCSCIFARESRRGWGGGRSPRVSRSLPVPRVWSPSPCPWLLSFTVRKGFVLGAEQWLGLLVPGVVLAAGGALWQRGAGSRLFIS